MMQKPFPFTGGGFFLGVISRLYQPFQEPGHFLFANRDRFSMPGLSQPVTKQASNSTITSSKKGTE